MVEGHIESTYSNNLSVMHGYTVTVHVNVYNKGAMVHVQNNCVSECMTNYHLRLRRPPPHRTRSHHPPGTHNGHHVHQKPYPQ